VKRAYWMAVLCGLLSFSLDAKSQGRPVESVNSQRSPQIELPRNANGELSLSLNNAVRMAVEQNPLLVVERFISSRQSRNSMKKLEPSTDIEPSRTGQSPR